MTETMKVNLSKTLTSLRILSAVAGVMVACGIAMAAIDSRMDRLESDQATFKGIMEERTRNMGEKLDLIYDIVKDWRPISGQTKEERQEEAYSQKKG